MNKLLRLIQRRNKINKLIESKLNNMSIDDIEVLNENLIKLGKAGLGLAGAYTKSGTHKISNKGIKSGINLTRNAGRFMINAIDDAVDKWSTGVKTANKAKIQTLKKDIKDEVIDSIKTGRQNIKDLPKNMRDRPYTTAGVATTLGGYAAVKRNQIKKKREQEAKEKQKMINKIKEKLNSYTV